MSLQRTDCVRAFSLSSSGLRLGVAASRESAAGNGFEDGRRSAETPLRNDGSWRELFKPRSKSVFGIRLSASSSSPSSVLVLDFLGFFEEEKEEEQEDESSTGVPRS
jgi:hypothetical protein